MSTRLAKSIMMLGLFGGAGCFPGHLLKSHQFEYRHPSVLWVYHPGHQLGCLGPLFLPIPFAAPLRHEVRSVKQGMGRVVIEEQATDLIEFLTWPWPVGPVVLDLGTGLPTLWLPIENDQERNDYIYSEELQEWMRPPSSELELFTRGRSVFIKEFWADEASAERIITFPPWQFGGERTSSGNDVSVGQDSDKRVAFLLAEYVIGVDIEQLPHLDPSTFPDLPGPRCCVCEEHENCCFVVAAGPCPGITVEAPCPCRNRPHSQADRNTGD